MQTQYLIIAKKVDNKRDPLRAVRAQLDHFPIHLADSIFVLSFLSISDSQSPVLIQHCPDHSPSTCCCVSAGSLLLCHILAFLRAKISFFPFSFFARRKILTPHPPQLTSTHTLSLTQWVASSPTAVEAPVPSPLHLIKSKSSK